VESGEVKKKKNRPCANQKRVGREGERFRSKKTKKPKGTPKKKKGTLTKGNQHQKKSITDLEEARRGSGQKKRVP